jgi:hypothetical protein
VIVPATYERGSDGVVRACSANLNFRKFVADGSRSIKIEPHEGLAFLLTPKSSHSDERFGLMAGIPAKGDHPVLTAILHALAVTDGRAYNKLAVQFREQTDALQKSETYYDQTPLERYCQLVVRLRDQSGQGLRDYAIELIDSQGRGDRFPTGFMAHAVQNPNSPETYVYYLNFDRVSRVVGGQVGIKVQSVSGSPLVAYEEIKLIGEKFRVESLLAPNQTTVVDVVIRRQLNKNIFRLTKNMSVQKIERKAGPEWI